MNALKSFYEKLPPESHTIAMYVSIGFVLGNLTTIALVSRPVFRSIKKTQDTLENIQRDNASVQASTPKITDLTQRVAILTAQNDLFKTLQEQFLPETKRLQEQATNLTRQLTQIEMNYETLHRAYEDLNQQNHDLLQLAVQSRPRGSDSFTPRNLSFGSLPQSTRSTTGLQ